MLVLGIRTQGARSRNFLHGAGAVKKNYREPEPEAWSQEAGPFKWNSESEPVKEWEPGASEKMYRLLNTAFNIPYFVYSKIIIR